MHRRKFLRNSILTIGALTIAQQNLLKAMNIVPWKIQMLTKELGIFTESGGTIIFHFTKEGFVIVDAQFPQNAKHLIDELQKKDTHPMNLLINTHHHGDHTAGNIAFKGLVKGVLAHENSLKNQRAVSEKNNNTEAQYFPTKTFTDMWSETVGGVKINLKYFGPAHTDGDAVIHFEKDNIIHMGDLVFNRRHPFIDKSAGANIKNWIKVLDDTMKTYPKETVYVCGHAGEGHDVVGKSDMLVAFKNYLINSLKFVDGQIRVGKSLDEILMATEIPGSPEWKGEGINRTINAAYQELKDESP